MTERKPSSAAGTALAWAVAASFGAMLISTAAWGVVWIWTQIAGLLS